MVRLLCCKALRYVSLSAETRGYRSKKKDYNVLTRVFNMPSFKWLYSCAVWAAIFTGSGYARLKYGTACWCINIFPRNTRKRYFKSSGPSCLSLSGIWTNIDVDKLICWGALNKTSGKFGKFILWFIAFNLNRKFKTQIVGCGNLGVNCFVMTPWSFFLTRTLHPVGV